MQKRQSSHQCLYALLGPTSVKAALKMLMKFTTFPLFLSSEKSLPSFCVSKSTKCGKKQKVSIGNLVWDEQFEDKKFDFTLKFDMVLKVLS